MLFHNEKLDHLKRIEVDAGIDYQDENVKQFALQMILHSAPPGVRHGPRTHRLSAALLQARLWGTRPSRGQNA